MKHRWLQWLTSRSILWLFELLWCMFETMQVILWFILITDNNDDSPDADFISDPVVTFQALHWVMLSFYTIRVILHFWYRMNADKGEVYVTPRHVSPSTVKQPWCVYLILRFSTTGLLCFINLFQLYVLASISDSHILWFFMTMLAFSNILFEIAVFYRVSEQTPDDNGMVTRFPPSKSESFVHAIPINQEGDTDERPLFNSDVGTVDEYMKAFQERKVIFLKFWLDFSWNSTHIMGNFTFRNFKKS